MHRTLLRGGVFLYPIDERDRATGGKLRLCYKANPMAFLTEQAGGVASIGRGGLLEVAPESPHQRVPVFLGARGEVELFERMHRAFDGERA